MAEREEEEEEVVELIIPGMKRPKRRRTCIITYLWSNVHDHLVEVLIIRRELSVLLFQGHELLRLGARYWLGAFDGWGTTVARKFSTVVLESPYTWFLSSLPDDPTSIHKSGSRSKWVEGSSPCLSLNWLL